MLTLFDLADVTAGVNMLNPSALLEAEEDPEVVRTLTGQSTTVSAKGALLGLNSLAASVSGIRHTVPLGSVNRAILFSKRSLKSVF